jgi:hypothetical protein
VPEPFDGIAVVQLEVPPFWAASPVIPPLADRFVRIDDNGVFCRSDVPDNPAMPGERGDQDPVTWNQVDQPLEDPGAGLSAWVAAFAAPGRDTAGCDAGSRDW